MSSAAIIERVFDSIETGEYFTRLINQPVPHRRRQLPEVVYHATLNRHAPQFTVVTPTFDYGAIVDEYIDATATNATLPFDWVLVDDGSEDATADRAKTIFASGRYPLVARATIVRNPVPVFETACDNLGFSLAETEVIVEIQCDIRIREAAYDELLLGALATQPKPAALSGRCGHSFFGLRPPVVRRLLGRGRTDCIGLCGKLIETPEAAHPLRGRLYRCDTVPRGPWVVLKSDLVRHGYLDERHFFLGDDDHDYHRRLFEAEGRRPLYVPMSLYSPLRSGASRKQRTGVNREVFRSLKAEKKGSQGFLRFLASQTKPSPPQQLS
jgi:GT2 family glycosyltransferase